MDNYKPSELQSTILKARKLFPGEKIYYRVGGSQTITEYIAELKRRIKEAESQQQST